jgi:hypothetical protein
MGYENDMVQLDDVIELYEEAIRYVYALEKIHGSSSFIEYKNGKINYHAGCLSSLEFSRLFNESNLQEVIRSKQLSSFRIHGEVYGGSIQGQKDRYGDKIRFVAFEVRLFPPNVTPYWLSVPEAEKFARLFDFDFVPYKKIAFERKRLIEARDEPSVQAHRNGIMTPQLREGNVIRPLVELVDGKGKRLIWKDTAIAFKEQLHHRRIEYDPEKQLSEKERQKCAQLIVEKYVLPIRFAHVIDHVLEKREMKKLTYQDLKDVLNEMVIDVRKDADKQDQIDWNSYVEKEMKRKTADWFGNYLKSPQLFLEQLTAFTRLPDSQGIRKSPDAIEFHQGCG